MHPVDISVEGRKSLCLAAYLTLVGFASEHHPDELQVVSFELRFGDTETWLTEAHHFQVRQQNFTSYTRCIYFL